MLQPRRVKHRKQHRGRRAGEAIAGNYVAFGEYGLQAEGAAWINSRHIESARRAIGEGSAPSASPGAHRPPSRCRSYGLLPHAHRTLLQPKL